MATYLEHKLRAQAQTTDATVTTCGSYTMADETCVRATAYIQGRQASSTNAGSYVVTAAVKRESAGGATLMAGSNPVTYASNEDTAGWNGTITVSGNNVIVTVTGAAGVTVNWDVVLEIVVFTPP